jgi:dephospho-CoA kinase
VLVVDCSEATQEARVLARSGWPQAQVAQVIRQQASRSARRAAADAVILNDTLTLAALEAEVDALWALGFFGVPASARL